MIKRLLWGGGIGLAGLIGAVVFGEHRALNSLEEMGIRYERLERGLVARTFYGVRYGSLSVGRVSASLLTPRTVKATDVHIRIQPESGSGQLGSEAPSALPKDLSASLESVSLSWDGETVVSGLSGTLDNGRVILDGDGIHLSSGADLMQADWDTTLPGTWASGEASLQLERGGRLKLSVTVPELTVDHALLHGQPVSFRARDRHSVGHSRGRGAGTAAQLARTLRGRQGSAGRTWATCGCGVCPQTQCRT